MTTKTLPSPLDRYVEEEEPVRLTHYDGWDDDDEPESDELVAELPPWFVRLLKIGNYALLTIVILGTLWIAVQIFIAFHSGRVRQIIHDAGPRMRGTSADLSSAPVQIYRADGARVAHCAALDKDGPHGCVLEAHHTVDELMDVWISTLDKGCNVVHPALPSRPDLRKASWKGGAE